MKKREAMKVEVGKRNGLVTYMEVDEDEQMSLSSRDSGPFIGLGIRGPNRVSV